MTTHINGSQSMPPESEGPAVDPEITMGELLLHSKMWIAIRGEDDKIIINKSTTTDEAFVLIGYLMVKDRPLREKLLSYLNADAEADRSLVKLDPEKDDPKKLGAKLLQSNVWFSVRIEEKGFSVNKSSQDDKAFILIIHLLIHSPGVRDGLLSYITQQTKFEI